MTNGDVKSVQGDTGHAEAEMVTDVYSEIIDEDRRYNAQKMDEQFYSTLNHDSEIQPQNEEVQPENNGLSDSDMELLQLLKSLTPENESNAFETISFKVNFFKSVSKSSKNSADNFFSKIKKSV